MMFDVLKEQGYINVMRVWKVNILNPESRSRKNPVPGSV